MRRYAVRFLVAILTFGIGVALSLVLGLFKPQPVNSNYVSVISVRRPSCPPKFRAVRPSVVTVDSELSDPLNLVYVGETADGRFEFLLQNRREQEISGYSLSGERIWSPHGRESDNTAFNMRSYEGLGPGESRSIFLPRTTESMSLRVATVTFQSGFTWMNPRDF